MVGGLADYNMSCTPGYLNSEQGAGDMKAARSSPFMGACWTTPPSSGRGAPPAASPAPRSSPPPDPTAARSCARSCGGEGRFPALTSARPGARVAPWRAVWTGGLVSDPRLAIPVSGCGRQKPCPGPGPGAEPLPGESARGGDLAVGSELGLVDDPALHHLHVLRVAVELAHPRWGSSARTWCPGAGARCRTPRSGWRRRRRDRRARPRPRRASARSGRARMSG